MNRRTFLRAITAAPALCLWRPFDAAADLPKAKITRVRIYRPPNLNPLFNQSNMVVTVETDIGITGIGEGGAKDTLEQCAGTLIGKNPFRIEAIWQEAYIAWFYPPGPREDPRARRARPRAVGHQGQGAGAAGSRAARRQRARLLRVLRDWRRRAARRRRPTRTLSLKERARATMEAGLPRVPHGRRRRADRRRLRHARGRPPDRAGLQGRPRRRRRRRQLVHRPPPALRSQRRAARLQGDGGVRAVLRRGSRSATSTRFRTSPSFGR